MQTWLASSLLRHYLASRPRRRRRLRLHVARGEQASFQVGFRTEAEPLEVTVRADCDSLPVTVRRVGYVPLPHHNTETPVEELDGIGYVPGYVPDPLFPETALRAGPFETNAFWITVQAPSDARPGLHRVSIALTAGQEHVAGLTATIRVHRAAVEGRRGLPVTQWFYCDALADWYRVAPFSDRFWPIVEKYLGDLAAHNVDTSHTPLFTPPTDGVKRPNQLLGVRRRGERYVFDWALVRRWVHTAQKQGIRYFEWPHFFTQWGAERPARIYEGRGEDERLLWNSETPAASPAYRGFLSQLLPEFKRFLEEEHILDHSFFHISDEPHGESGIANYRGARELVRELAPWMKVMDALSDIRFAREDLTDFPIAILSAAADFLREGHPTWVYFWSGPRGRYAQRLLDTPLVKTRMLGWLLYRLKANGLLHWGYNYWYRSQTRELIDPYEVNDAHSWPDWAYGDPFVVYPGDDGPVDSLRWEVFAESLQDYALLQAAGVEPDDAALSGVKGFAEFPRSESWIRRRRAELLATLDER